MRNFFLIIALFICCKAIGQQGGYTPPTRAQLEAKKKEILDAIKETESELEAVKNDKRATMTQLKELQTKLSERQHLIANINDELDDIDNNIKSSSQEVNDLKHKLEQLKIQYAQSIRYDYETRSSLGVVAYLFSSDDFNDALRRMKYLKKFRDFRKLQSDLIRNTQDQIQHKIGVLNTQKKEKDELLNEQEHQKQTLTVETNKTNQVMQELKSKESDLMKEIEKNKKVANRINKAVNDIIEREMAKAAEKARKEREAHPQPVKPPAAPANGGVVKTTSKTNNPPNTVKPVVRPESEPLALTPTDIALANNFEGNKGKLYWPVEKGFISDHFGKHQHPLAANVEIDNAGIDIRTSASSPVRAVFEGNVSSVFSVEGWYVITIQHGNYFTVYNGLKTVSVTTGQYVKTLQNLGTVAENDEGEPTIKFQIWKANGKKGGSMKLNPEQWLGRLK